MCVCVYLKYQKHYVDFKYVYLQKKLWKKILQDIIIVQMYEIMKIQMHNQSTWYFCFKFFYRFVDLEKSLRMKIIYFHLDKVWKR